MSASCDVLVVGGGPVGACAAHALAADGASVTLIEKEGQICPPVSGAHANCGLLMPSYVTPLAAPGALGHGLRWLRDSSSPFYIAPRPSGALLRWLWLYRAAATPARARAAAPVLHALHAASADLHDALAREGGERWLYHHDGIVQAYEAPDAMDEAADEAEAARGLGVRADILSPAEVRARFPGHRGAVAGGLFFPDDGHMDPALFTRAMADKAAAAGAEVRRGTEAIALEPAGTGAVRVVTTRGDFVADQVVLAAGAGTPALTKGLDLALPIEPAKGYSVDIERPDDFPELPLYLGDAHCVLTPLGDALRLGSTLELSGWDMTIRRQRVAGLRRAAERVMGIPADAPVRQVWRGPRPVTPDGLPVVGRVSRRERVILATGHCMLGLSLGPVTGKLVAELAGGRPPSLDLKPLSPIRFG
ncbi:MAG: FAD-dependent oxidoreductase [Actinobacteria bacterium]|nr:FAD-dependent oxidoreductase [Actinomycetota bacterium]